MTIKELIKELDAKRKSGKWYYFTGIVENRQIGIKGYETWLQLFTVDGIQYGGNMDIKVSEWKVSIIKAISK